jgi:hypothetical protein
LANNPASTSGLETIDHLAPFHVSTNVLLYLESQSPTAVHVVAAVHETPDRYD